MSNAMTERDAPTNPLVLRVVFLVHGLITLAGAVVMTVFPTLIPAAVGIRLERSDYLVVYLVAAAELAAAVLSFGAIRITDSAALRLIIATFATLHLASGILEIVYSGQVGASVVLVANVCLRFIVVAVLVLAWGSARRP